MLTSLTAPSRAKSHIELPLLASEAAIEFDCAIRGRNIGFESAQLLGQFIQQDAVNDFVSENLVFQALATSRHGAGVTSIDKAAEASSYLAAWLADPTHEQPEQWSQLRDFCVAFSDKLVKHRQLLRASLPSNPNKR